MGQAQAAGWIKEEVGRRDKDTAQGMAGGIVPAADPGEDKAGVEVLE